MCQSRTRVVLLLIAILVGSLQAQTSPPDPGRISALEAQLIEAQKQVDALQSVIRGLGEQVAALRSAPAAPTATPIEQAKIAASEPTDARTRSDFVEQMLVTDLGHDERGGPIEAKPELFIQSRYQEFPIDGATGDEVTTNFSLSRMEVRWAGRVSDKVGMGYELQFHPAVDGAAEELINDAFVEYYPTEAITLKVGQFVKPFGFDIQHSSSVRLSPERGIFAGYFFPGQRDRGLMLSTNLADTTDWLHGTTLYAGVFNGNRFFDDSNRQVNYNLRLRKVLDSIPVAVGASVQLGKQLLPPEVTGNDDENIYGVDIQFVLGRFGIRGEYMVGNMPSTLLSLEPEFAAGFMPGSYSSGGAVLLDYSLSRKDNIYGRYDQFNNDPVTRKNVHAYNMGYTRQVGPHSRIGIDYQFKDHVTFNDDDLNTSLTVTWNVLF
jgi:hypothetical protein